MISAAGREGSDLVGEEENEFRTNHRTAWTPVVVGLAHCGIWAKLSVSRGSAK